MNTRLHRLGNGLTIVVDPMPGAQSAAVGLYAGVGSRFEADGKGGLAHMVEHMVFKGAGSRDARAIAEAIEDVGGQLNAWTSRDQTVFHARALGGDVPLAVELIADLVRAPRFDADDLEREKGVILSELGEILDTPEDLAGDLLFEAAFAEQPFGRPVIGTEPTIRGFERADLTGWMDGQMTPDRLMLVVTGAVDEGRLLPMAEQHFGDMSPSSGVQLTEACFTGGQRVDRRRSEQAHWSFALPAPPAADATMPAYTLFTQALGGGMSSRLFQQLREERGLCYSVYAWVQGFADTGLFVVSAATDRADAPASLALAREVVSRAADDLGETELNRARAQVEASLLMSLETVQGRADHHARSVELFGRLLAVQEVLADYRAVDLAAAREAGQKLLAGPIALASVGGGALALAA
ncbi:MAG TPA: pitrilysin family protein [Sphingomicrobium sp.]|nr:pitrilysin family protein [Sphingomicrobium sp.]